MKIAMTRFSKFYFFDSIVLAAKKKKTDSLNDSLKEMSISAGNAKADIDSN